MSKLNTTFLTGLVTLVPIAATLYFLYWLAVTTESLLGRGVRLVLPEQYYIPGTGVAVSLLLELKAGFPKVENVTLLLEPNVDYQALITVMDRVRSTVVTAGLAVENIELFPVISIGDAPPANRDGGTK